MCMKEKEETWLPILIGHGCVFIYGEKAPRDLHRYSYDHLGLVCFVYLNYIRTQLSLSKHNPKPKITTEPY